MLSLDEFLQIRREVIKPTSQGHCIEEDIASSEIEAMAPPGCDDLPPGEEPPPPVQTVAEIPRPLDVKVPPGVGKPEKADTKEEDEKFVSHCTTFAFLVYEYVIYFIKAQSCS